MTRDEAIQFLDNMKHAEAGRAIGKEGFYAELLGYHIQALNMAIKALEQQTCEDAISRKAAIAETYRDCTYVKSDKDAYEQLQCIRDGINKLPSVQPKPTECEDAVSREAVLGLFAQNADTVRPYSKTWEEVKALPPVNPQPKTGHWISHYDEDAKEGWYECDRCHTERAFNTDYCPDCGAKMVEPQERSCE